MNQGGDFNTISGTVIFDSDENGCELIDDPRPFIKFNLTNDDSGEEGISFTDSNGIYTFHTGPGSFNINPDVETPAWFNIDPISVNTNFVDINNNMFSQDFCITPNGIHNDLEIILMRRSHAMPGFDATYKVIFKNKGNQVLSGAIDLVFDGTILDFVSATPLPDGQTAGSLTWNYSDLMPFETRRIELTMNLNSPTETPAVNIGDILDYTVEINPMAGDESVSDNTFDLQQTVVGSEDPNDITCLEGDIVDPELIGEYLHYNIRF